MHFGQSLCACSRENGKSLQLLPTRNSGAWVSYNNSLIFFDKKNKFRSKNILPFSNGSP